MSVLRVRKLFHDLLAMRGRVALMIFAIALSATAAIAMLDARALLGRAIVEDYSATEPASATIVLDDVVDAEALALASSVPGVEAATPRGALTGRIRAGDGPWRSLLVFVRGAGDPMTLATVRIEHGADAAGLLLERTALRYLGIRAGDDVELSTAAGNAVMPVAGAAHDGGVAPAEQEQTVYAYTADTLLAAAGLPIALDQIKILVTDASGAPSGDAKAIEGVAQRVRDALESRGYHVDHLEVPRPLAHPHQGQMETIGAMFLSFGVLALVLSSVLAAALLAGALVRQIPQIGAMKAIGATTAQLIPMTLGIAVVVSLAATVLALAPGFALGEVVAGFGASLLNLDLAEGPPPAWVWATAIAAGVGIPTLIASVPVWRTTRITVREALDADRPNTVRRRSRLHRLGGDRTLAAAIRGLARRPGRLALNLGLLATAGAMFLAGVNAAAGWDELVASGTARAHYDVAVRLDAPRDPEAVEQLLGALPDVSEVEAYGSARATVHVAGRADVARVYPDEGHASFFLAAPPIDSALAETTLVSGRRLTATDRDAVVVTTMAAALQLGGARVGDRVSLTVAGRVADWRIVGIVSDFGSPATGYTTPEAFVERTGVTGVRSVRIVTGSHARDVRTRTVDSAVEALRAGGIATEQAYSVDTSRIALDGHVGVLIAALIVIAGIVGIVGFLGLGASLTTSVVERTREFAILAIVGATPRDIRALVTLESLLIGIGGVLAATALSVPFTLLADEVFGRQAFLAPLPFSTSTFAIAVWAIVSVAGALAASVLAARRATRITPSVALAAL
jgi:putative ABC transport system permease protein